MNILEKARPENSFRCADGSVLGSVYELENKLCTMSYETFHHHVNPVRNDFHNWVKDVFQDYELANELLKAKTPAEAAATVRKHLRKELLAKEEIENAIKTASTTKTKQLKAVRAMPRKKQQKPTKRKIAHSATSGIAAKAALGNRKLIKKHNTRQHGRKINSRGSTKSKYHSSSRKKRGRASHKRIKKQVNRWLNWLKILPEQ